MLFYFFIIVSFVVWFIPKYLKYRRTKKFLDMLPGPKINHFLGELWLFLLQLNKEIHVVVTNVSWACARLFRREGIFTGWILFRPFAAVYKAELVEAILSSNSNINKSVEYELLEPWLGQGLITSNGSMWRRHRKVLTPAFHFRILEEFIPIVNEQGKILIDKLNEKAEEEWIDLLPFITRCTLDIICETSMGIQLGSQSHKEPEYVKALHCVQETFLWRSAFPWLQKKIIFYSLPMGRRFLKSLKIAQAFTRQVIAKRKADFLQRKRFNNPSEEKEKTKTRLALLDLLLHYHIQDQVFTEEEIQDEVNTFMFAGHDTTSLGITWTLYLLGLHPEVQTKVQEELGCVFGTDKNRQVTIDDLKSMKYLECVIKESQRLYPPVPLVARRITEDVVINGKDIIPVGTACMVVITALHRDETVFHKPHEFIPERFLPEYSRGRHPYAFVPFSAGPRNCIGQRFAMNEEKIIISNVLRNFKVISLDNQDSLVLDGNVTLKPRGPIRIKLIPKE